MRRSPKKIIVILVLLLVVVVSLSWFASQYYHQKQTSNTSTTQRELQPQTVTLTNTTSFQQEILKGSIKTIESQLYEQLQDNSSGTHDSYAGEIRAKSFDVTFYSRDGVKIPSITFLVDIPAASQTYQVSLFGGKGYPMSTLYILCPTPDQLKYGAFTCNDAS